MEKEKQSRAHDSAFEQEFARNKLLKISSSLWAGKQKQWQTLSLFISVKAAAVSHFRSHFISSPYYKLEGQGLGWNLKHEDYIDKK